MEDKPHAAALPGHARVGERPHRRACRGRPERRSIPTGGQHHHRPMGPSLDGRLCRRLALAEGRRTATVHVYDVASGHPTAPTASRAHVAERRHGGRQRGLERTTHPATTTSALPARRRALPPRRSPPSSSRSTSTSSGQPEKARPLRPRQGAAPHRRDGARSPATTASTSSRRSRTATVASAAAGFFLPNGILRRGNRSAGFKDGVKEGTLPEAQDRRPALPALCRRARRAVKCSNAPDDPGHGQRFAKAARSWCRGRRGCHRSVRGDRSGHLYVAARCWPGRTVGACASSTLQEQNAAVEVPLTCRFPPYGQIV